MEEVAIISCTKKGDEIAKIISSKIPSKVYLKEEIVKEGIFNITKEAFENYRKIAFISSTGIAVRAIAPLLKDKTKDPGVIVIDSSSKFVISLLSGHIGGGNKLAIDISSLLKATPVITTATDNLNIEAPDSFAEENGLIIDDMLICKKISTLLIEGKKVGFIDKTNSFKCPKGYSIDRTNLAGIVYVTDEEILEKEEIPVLKIIKRDIVIGIGSKKGVTFHAMKEFLLNSIKELNIDKRAIKIVSTVEVKKDERAILEIAKELNAELKIYKIDDIKKVQDNFEGSLFVEKTIGVKSVAEPVVFLSGGVSITKRLKKDGITLCIGRLKG